MKNTIAKYLIEFIVIITGISLSFYVEKLNETNYKENLKNQSLGRILKNIEVDTKDFKFNLDANKKSIYSTEWLAERNDELQLYSRDSVGYHLNRAIFFNTILVDNQEEYRGLQNSGLIELIDNENLVTNLQEKYVTHEFFKKIEDFILKKMCCNFAQTHWRSRFLSFFSFLFPFTKLIQQQLRFFLNQRLYNCWC